MRAMGRLGMTANTQASLDFLIKGEKMEGVEKMEVVVQILNGIAETNTVSAFKKIFFQSSMIACRIKNWRQQWLSIHIKH